MLYSLFTYFYSVMMINVHCFTSSCEMDRVLLILNNMSVLSKPNNIGLPFKIKIETNFLLMYACQVKTRPA